MKSAPEFCAVYVITKGKVQSKRLVKGNTDDAAISSKSPTGNNSARSYFTTSSMSSFSSSSTSNHGNSKLTYSGSGKLNSPHPESPRSTASDDFFRNDSRASSFDEYCDFTERLQRMLRDTPTNPYRAKSDDLLSRDYYSTESRTMEEMDHTPPWSNEGALTPARFSPCPGPQPRFQQSPGRLLERAHNPPYMRPPLLESSTFSLASTASHESSILWSDYTHTSGWTSSNSSYATSFTTAYELDAEIQRVKPEIRKTMEIYQSISDQEAAARNKAGGLLNRDETHHLEEIILVEQPKQIVADLEQLKTKAATDLALLTERLKGLEAEKRQFSVQMVKSKEGDRERAANNYGLSHRVYSLEEIEEATNYFSASQQIGEGGYGPVYRAKLQHTPVAIKVLRPDVSQGLQQFHKEIEVLGRIRHPNMVLLLGACPEYGCLVYEYMDYGSLEDKLFCKDNTAPIPWRIRFKIAAEIATALLFLHQNKPEPIVHRDLKPANILLDGNYTSKIADVGLARLVPQSVIDGETQYHETAAAGTFCYIDPEYQQSGLLGTKSDVYSLGVILLQLLTAKPPMGLAYTVEEAIEMGDFANMLDPAIPDCPIEQALSMAQLAIKCCELRKKDRPDLATIVLPELFRLKESTGSS